MGHKQTFPLVIVTGALGANVYVTKPVAYERFANAIRLLGLVFVMQVPETN